MRGTILKSQPIYDARYIIPNVIIDSIYRYE